MNFVAKALAFLIDAVFAAVIGLAIWIMGKPHDH